MSDVLDRLRQPRRTVPAARSSSTRIEPVASVWVRGAAGATWAVLVGVATLIVLTLVIWSADSRSVASAGGAMRFAVQLWLLAHHAPLTVTGGSLAIPPLGLTIVLGLLVARATAIVARGARCDDARDVGTVILSVTAPYVALTTMLAILTPSATLHPSVRAGFVCAVVVGGVAATIGAIRGSGLARPTWRGLPVPLRTSVDAAGRGGLVLLGAATVLTIGSLLVHASEFGTIAGDYHAAPGEISMVVLSLLMIPNAIVFSLSYLVGTGFAIGSGTSVGIGGSHLGAVPAFPLLAAVPTGRASVVVEVLCLVSVVGAGAAVGMRIARPAKPVKPSTSARRRSTEHATALSTADQARAAVVAAVGLGIAAAMLAGFAGGPAGPGRLSAVGPSPWHVGLAVAGEVSVVAVLVVLVTSWVGLARQSRS